MAEIESCGITEIDMTMAELETLVTGSLDRPGDPEPWSSRSGSVLASDLASIRPGRFYVIGINPGGDEGVHGVGR